MKIKPLLPEKHSSFRHNIQAVDLPPTPFNGKSARKNPRKCKSEMERPYPFLYELRQTANMTQAEIAHYLNLSSSAYANKELGRREFSPDEMGFLTGLFCHRMEEIFMRREVYVKYMEGITTAERNQKDHDELQRQREEALEIWAKSQANAIETGRLAFVEMGAAVGRARRKKIR